MTLLEAEPKNLDKHNKDFQAFRRNAEVFLFFQSHSPTPLLDLFC